MKFKVWDSEEKEFVDDVEKESGLMSCFAIGQDGNLLHYNWAQELLSTPENYTPVFSTGQTDKNGVEIYEGDIVKTSQSTCIIEWSEDKKIQGIKRIAFLLYALPPMSGLTVLGEYHTVDELEIIGNKYENPELMENHEI